MRKIVKYKIVKTADVTEHELETWQPYGYPIEAYSTFWQALVKYEGPKDPSQSIFVDKFSDTDQG